MKLIKIYDLIKEAKDELTYLVEPVVKEDIRPQRNKLQKALDLLKEIDL